jgi:polysaccharide biosynthesis protein PslG
MSAASPHTTPRRAHLALGTTIVALLVALIAGALPMLQGASADTVRPLVNVSFRPAGARPVTNWQSDNGAAFDSRRAYGWVRDNDRNQPVSMAKYATSRSRSRAPGRTETFVTMQPPKQVWGRWVLAVADGTYRVRVTVGDPSGAAGNQTLAVEGTRVVDNFKVTSRHRTTTETADVKVKDGRLTLDPLYPNRSTKTKLISVQVSRVLGDDHPPTTEPPTTEPPTSNPPPTTNPPTTNPPTTQPPTTQPPTGNLRNMVGFAGGGKFLTASDAEIKRELDGMAAAGGTWLRIGYLWSSIEQSRGTYYWARMDQVTGWARERGLRILANVSYTPDWARPSDCRDMMCPPANMDDYANFMGTLVDHYSALGVKHFEVWNEPNQNFWWKPKPNPARYAEMLRKASAKAHQADPNVTIVAGAMALARDNESGTTLNPRTFLEGMYRAGASGTFDALSYHPYTGTEDPRVVAYWSPLGGVGPDLAGIMAAHGDAGVKIWGTEFAYSTGHHSKSVTEAEQAQLLRLAFATWQSKPWAGPLFLFTYRDMGTDPSVKADNFGLVKRDFTPKQALHAVRQELLG